MTKASSSYNADKKQLDKVVGELEKVNAELDQGGFNEEEYARMSTRHNNLENQCKLIGIRAERSFPFFVVSL